MSRLPEGPTGRAAPTPLFRPELVAEQEARWLGRVVLLPRLSQTLAAAVTLALTLALGTVLATGRYTQTERLVGWLVAESEAASGDAVPGAHLYAPAPLAGTLRPGQDVRLRIEGAPSSGLLTGVIDQVEPAEMPPEEVAARAGAEVPDGPLFLVQVDLVAVSTWPKDGMQPLATMPVEADVRIASRPVWRWVLGLSEAGPLDDPA